MNFTTRAGARNSARSGETYSTTGAGAAYHRSWLHHRSWHGIHCKILKNAFHDRSWCGERYGHWRGGACRWRWSDVLQEDWCDLPIDLRPATLHCDQRRRDQCVQGNRYLGQPVFQIFNLTREPVQGTPLAVLRHAKATLFSWPKAESKRRRDKVLTLKVTVLHNDLEP